MAPSATSEVLVDDERVRVTRFDFAPGRGDRLAPFTDMDYVVTPVTDCHFCLKSPAARPAGSDAGGEAYRRPLVSSTMSSMAAMPMSFVEVELKS
jgi:hypothetical protein